VVAGGAEKRMQKSAATDQRAGNASTTRRQQGKLRRLVATAYGITGNGPVGRREGIDVAVTSSTERCRDVGSLALKL